MMLCFVAVPYYKGHVLIVLVISLPLDCAPANFTSYLFPRNRQIIRGLQGDIVYLSWPIAPLVYEPKCDGVGAGVCGVWANENSCAHHVTWSPNRLWRSNFILYLTYANNTLYSTAGNGDEGSMFYKHCRVYIQFMKYFDEKHIITI